MRASALLAAIPSPPVNGVSLGPVRLHIYGFMIALGVVAAVWLAGRRWAARGGPDGAFTKLAVWGVPAGLVGARLYSVVTSWQADTGGHWIKAFEIWDGGLGIWGGIAVGVPFGLWGARRNHFDWRAALDCAAPGLLLAQAIGRWGNYFNQELYGWRSNLPWAVRISHPVACHSVTACVALPPNTTYQPTFLYESLWDFAGVLIILWAERRFRIRKGYLFWLYACVYVVGRFVTEFMRIDEAHRYLGLRLNDWTCIVVFVVGAVILALRGRAGPGQPTTLAPVVLPAGATPAVGGGADVRGAGDVLAEPAAAGRRLGDADRGPPGGG